ncbi:MAG: ribose ABC transporter permease [Clostridiales Family XIII bacterium]|nr:ribose ABC transporter permease [Clostridiales Family XIII bacterium]
MNKADLRQKRSLKETIFLGDMGILVALIVLCVVMGILSPVFFSVDNWKNILVQVSINAVIAAGMGMVILTGGIDLSVGAIVAVCGLVLGVVMVYNDGPIWQAVVLSCLVGTAFGAANGLLIAKLKMPPFIATLGMMSIARGFAYTISDGTPIYMYPKKFLAVAGNLGPIPIPIIIMVAVFVVAFYILKYTKLGRYTYAIGGSESAAILSGINVPLYKFIIYTITGFLCSISAIILTARIDSAIAVAAEGYELDAIGAVVIGGTSMLGGEGRISGTIIGVLIYGVVSNGLNLLTVPQGNQRIIKGIIIIVAVLIDVLRKRKRV